MRRLCAVTKIRSKSCSLWAKESHIYLKHSLIISQAIQTITSVVLHGPTCKLWSRFFFATVLDSWIHFNVYWIIVFFATDIQHFKTDNQSPPEITQHISKARIKSVHQSQMTLTFLEISPALIKLLGFHVGCGGIYDLHVSKISCFCSYDTTRGRCFRHKTSLHVYQD